MARLFSDNAHYVDIDNPMNPPGSITICARVRMTVGVDFGRALANRSGVIAGYQAILGSGSNNDKLRFRIAIGGSLITVTPATGIADGSWHYWVGQYTSGATDLIEVFVDDMDVADGSDSGVYGDYDVSADNLTIGNQPGGGAQQFPGDIADVLIYYTALTAGQRKAAKAGRLIVPSALHAPLGYAAEPDWSGNGHTLTVSGTAISDNPPVMPLFVNYDCEPSPVYGLPAKGWLTGVFNIESSLTGSVLIN